MAATKGPNKTNTVSLSDIEVNDTSAVRLVNRAITITFLVMALAVVAAAIVAFSASKRIAISTEGLVSPSEIIHVNAPEAGIVRTVLVKSGDTVAVGQVLLVLESLESEKRLLDIEFRAAIEENTLRMKAAQAALDREQDSISLIRAKIQLKNSEESLGNRINSFFPRVNVDSLVRNYVPGGNMELENAMADVRNAEENFRLRELDVKKHELNRYDLKTIRIKLENLYARRRILKDQLKTATVRSPVLGIVAREGLKRMLGAFVSRGAGLFDIAEMDKWEVVLFVNQKEVNRLKINDKVKLRLDAPSSKINDELFDGTVTSVEEEPRSDNYRYPEFAGLYRVAIGITSAPHQLDINKLKHGSKVKGEIIVHSDRIIELLLMKLRRLI